MPTLTDDAICIRRWDFSETSQTVSLFTRMHGVIRGLAKGAKRERGSFSGGIDLLSRGQIVAITKPGRDLATLTEWDLQEVHWPLRQHLAAHQAGLYCADLVHRMITDHDPHPNVFDALAATLQTLGEPGTIDAALLRFQWSLVTEAGYQPQVLRDVETGQTLPEQETYAFTPRGGGLVADNGAGDRWRVRAATVQLLARLARNEDTSTPDPDTTRRAGRLLAAYIREILGVEPPTARWVYGDLPR